VITQLGEVRAKVKLTNSADMAMLRRNLIQSTQLHSVEADALVDTGAVSLVLPSFVVERLGLARPFKQIAEYADGRRDEVDVTEPVLVELMDRHTNEEALVLGDEVIIGQTILEKLDLHVDCRERRLLPDPSHPDQPVLKVK
jgi:clan AA aspartic protease